MTRSITLKNATDVVETTEEEPTPAQLESEQNAQYVLATAARSHNETWRVYISTLDEATGVERKLFSMPLTNELDTIDDRLRDTYGSGSYWVRVYHKKEGETLQKVHKSWITRILAPPKTQQTERASEMGAVLSTFDKLVQRMEGMMLRMQQPQASPVAAIADPLAQVTAIVTAMKGLKELTGPEINPGKAIGDAILQGIQIANTARGEAGGDDDSEVSVMGLAKSAIDAFFKNGGLEMIARAQPGLAALPKPVAQIPPPGTPGAPVQTQAPQAQPNQAQEIAELRQKILYLCTVAARGGNPELYAEWVVDNMTKDQVTSILQRPDALQLLQQLVPEATPYIPWFAKLIAAIKEIVDDTSAAPRPNGSNAPSDISPVQPIGDTGWSGGSESDFEGDV